MTIRILNVAIVLVALALSALLVKKFFFQPPQSSDYQLAVVKDGLRLYVTFFQRDSDVYIDIYQAGLDDPLFKTEIKNSPGAKYIKHSNGWECLEIAAPHRSVFFEEEWIIPNGARIRVNPRITVEMFQPSD